LKQRNGLAGFLGRGMRAPCPHLLTSRCIWADRALPADGADRGAVRLCGDPNGAGAVGGLVLPGIHR